MKNIKKLLLVAVLAVLSAATAWGQAPVNTVLWEETWTDGAKNETPSSYGFSGTTVYGGAKLTYAQTSTDTKLYTEALAGGTSPELLLKPNQTWTISNIPTGQAEEMSLSFLSNKTTFAVTSTTEGITISGSQKSWTIKASSDVSNFNLTIKNTGSKNARIDDIVLKVTKAGSGGSTIVSTTTTISDSGIINTDISKGTSAGSLSATVKDDQSATISGATVTWSGDNDDVATINANTGAVTLKGIGIVTFTASYAGVDGQYQSSSATYKMTVKDSSNPISTLVFTAACGGSGTANDGAEWIVTSDGTESTYESERGIHYGTGSVAVKYIRLSTSDISGTIKKVVVNASTASGVSATVGVTVGGSAFGGDAQSLNSTATDYTFNGSASGEIVVLVTKSSSAPKALYVKSVDVTYSSGPATYKVTYNSNGATSGTVPTDANEYVSGESVTVLGNTGNLAKAGYVYNGWNTNAEGTGTNYSAGDPFSITANTTLFAKWNPKSITSLSYTGTPTKTQYSAGESFDPAGLTVTATFNDESQENVTSQVVWTPNPLTTGTTSVTGTYMGQTVIVSGLTVTAAKGSEDNPYTVEEAIAATPTSGTSADVYIRGIVSAFYNTSIMGDGTNYRYYISDNGTTDNQLLIYRGKNLGNNSFSDNNDLIVGDLIVIKGGLTKYNNTPEVAANNYLISLKLPAPSFYPETGSVAEDTELTISNVHPDASIYYTTDGSNPTTNSTEYNSESKPVITSAQTFKAIATKSGNGYITSDVATASYTLLTPAATPIFSPGTGEYTWAQNVTISTPTEGATIYYTTDGSNPTTSSTKYTDPISVSETMTIKAIAAKNGLANSNVAEATYTMIIPIINAENINLSFDATSGVIDYSLTNEVEGGVITAAITGGNDADWLTLEGFTFSSAVNEGGSARIATITLTYSYESNKTVKKDITVSQGCYSSNFAELPFEFIGSEANTPLGITLSGTSKYSSSPYIKFDGTNDYVLLQFNESLGTLAFDIKGNPSNNEWVGSFKLQTSVDGIIFFDHKEYTSFGDKGDEMYSESIDDINSSVRYLKWIFIEKNKGNVGLGNIILTPVEPASTIELDVTFCGGHYWATFYNRDASYNLPEGAKAFVMDSEHNLFILGDGRLIQKGTAVIIMADIATNSRIELTKTNDPESDLKNKNKNILESHNYPTAKVSITSTNKEPYVLGIVNGLGFYIFNGTSIPANKAYYTVNNQ